MGNFQLTAGRNLRLAVFLFAGLAIGALWLRNKNAPPPESDTDARIAFYSARATGRGSYPAYARLGAAYLQKARETGDSRFYPLAETNLKKSHEFQLNFEAIRSLAALSLDLHRFDDALRYSQEAVHTMPGDPESQGLLFDTQLALGRTAEAATTLQMLQAAGPHSFGVLTRQANLQELRGDLRGALASIEQACAQAEASKLSRASQAWCQVRLGSLKLLANCDKAGAEAAYRRALQLLPDYFHSNEHLAELYAAQDKYDEAVRLYQRLISSGNPSYRLALADVLDAEGKKNEAAVQRTAALNELQERRAAGDRAHLLELAFMLLETSDSEGAPAGSNRREALKIAMDEVAIRRDVFALDALAWAQFVNGDNQAAVATMQEALRGGTKNAGVLLHAAEIFFAASEKDRARRVFVEAMRCPVALTPGERAATDRVSALAEDSRAPD